MVTFPKLDTPVGNTATAHLLSMLHTQALHLPHHTFFSSKQSSTLPPPYTYLKDKRAPPGNLQNLKTLFPYNDSSATNTFLCFFPSFLLFLCLSSSVAVKHALVTQKGDIKSESAVLYTSSTTCQPLTRLCQRQDTHCTCNNVAGPRNYDCTVNASVLYTVDLHGSVNNIKYSVKTKLQNLCRR